MSRIGRIGVLDSYADAKGRETMSNDKPLVGDFVVHDYNTEDHGGEVQGKRAGIEDDGPLDVLVDEPRNRSFLSVALRSMSVRLRGAVRTRPVDSAIAYVAESAATSADSLAQTIDEEGLGGIGGKTVDFVRSNSKAVAASAAGLGLIAIEAWRRGDRRSRS